jgi:hypothetical protein
VNPWDGILELVAYLILALAIAFFCAVMVHLLLDHHDPDVPTHGAGRASIADLIFIEKG